MTPLKILHVISVVAPRYGGAGIAPQLMARYQAKMGQKVTICTTNAEYPKGSLSVTANTPYYRNRVLVIHFEVTFRPLLFSVPLFKWINANISSFDIVHIHGLYRFPVTSAAWLARRSNIPYMISLHGSLDPFLYKKSQYNVFLKRIYERLLDMPNLNNATAIHYTADEELKRSAFLKLRSKPVVAPNGIDWDCYQYLPKRGRFRRNIGLDTRTPLVLFLGRINFKKGLDILIPAFSRVAKKRSDVHLAIVGPDNEGYCAQVRQWCMEHKIQDRVFFVDYLGVEKVNEAYVDADVFVLPSYTENFGLTVVEAMACETPVVISDQVNICQQVQNAGAGIVVSCDDSSVERAICQVLDNPKIAKTMGMNGRVAAEKLFSWHRIAMQFIQVYRDLIAQKTTNATCRTSD